ncbi:MAG: hypothetical protein AB4057_08750 [Crocosphaera sp.]
MGKWLSGVVSAVIAGLIVYFITEGKQSTTSFKNSSDNAFHTEDPHREFDSTESISPRLVNAEWGNFKSNDPNYQYIILSGPDFNDQQRKVKWTVDKRCLVEICFKNLNFGGGFQAKFIDIEGITLESGVSLNEEGDGYPKRYTLIVPQSVWQRWSEITRIEIYYSPI